AHAHSPDQHRCGRKHVLPAYHAEVFDETGRRIGREGTGRFAFTNLIKRSTPMVRYLLDDWVTLRASRCPYGFEVSVEPHGRYELSAVVGGERRGLRHYEEELFRHGLLGDYRVELLPGRCRVVAETYGASPDPAAVGAALRDRFGGEAEVELVSYGALTDYRAVRETKPILRLVDHRPASEQTVPVHL
ncbi:MAG: hypothetical protein ACE5JG_13040, partial [Planctomycetota bacterium]